MSKETIQQLIEWHVIDNDGQWNHVTDEVLILVDEGQFKCTREEFNAAADRMRGKPDWKDAPDWAQWMAQDDNGSWWFYSQNVSHNGSSFVCPSGCSSRKAGFGKVIGDWRNTLEKRPEQKPLPSIADRYGVEIPWDGRNALPSGVDCNCEVEVTLALGGAKYTKTGNANRFNWMLVKSYKVIDKRYKPAEPAPDKSWFEAGELPAIGTVVELLEETEFLSLASGEVTKISKGAHCHVVGHAKRQDNGNMCVTLMSVINVGAGFCTGNPELLIKPIRTEREKAIDAAIEAMQPNSLTGTMALWFGKLYDAGLLRLPDQK